MITSSKSYCISCNKCYEPLVYEKESIMIAHIGHIIYEDNPENIKEVAKSKGWDIEKHICKKCLSLNKNRK